MAKINGNTGWLINLASLITVAIAGTLWFSNKFHAIELFHAEVRHEMGDLWTGSDQVLWNMQLEKALGQELPDPHHIIRDRLQSGDLR